MSVGGAPRAVAEQVRDADWAPDGSLAVIRYVAGKNRIEYPIGTTLYETPHALGGSGASSSGIRVSPDGSQVAFFEHSVEQISVKVVDRFAHVTTLTNAFSAGAGLAWTPDSTTVVFTASEVGTSGELQMYAVAAAAGSPVRRLPQSAGGLEITDLARNGAVLALRQDISTGMVVMLAGAPAERDMSWLNRSENPTLSRDGAWLLFSDVGASTSAGPVTLRRRTDGSPPERLGKGSALGLSPDGKWALSGVQGSESSRVMLYATGPGEPIALPRGPIERVLSADWFPDGRRILVCGNEASHAPRCYVQDVAGGAPKPATAEGMLTTAAPSPDGMRLLGLGPDGVWQIIALDGSPQEIARGLRPDDIAVDWSTDGRAVFVTGNGAVPQRLERVDLLTGARSLIKQLAPVDRVGVTYIAVSSVRDDGREYAYSYYRSLSTLYQIDGLNLSRAP
jgi:hypothetical protein